MSWGLRQQIDELTQTRSCLIKGIARLLAQSREPTKDDLVQLLKTVKERMSHNGVHAHK